MFFRATKVSVFLRSDNTHSELFFQQSFKPITTRFQPLLKAIKNAQFTHIYLSELLDNIVFFIIFATR